MSKEKVFLDEFTKLLLNLEDLNKGMDLVLNFFVNAAIETGVPRHVFKTEMIRAVNVKWDHFEGEKDDIPI